MFSVDNYEKNKKEISAMIKETLPKWKTTQGFVLDGLFDPEEYEKQTVKILYILGEYYNKEKEGEIDCTLQIKKDDTFYDFWGLRKAYRPTPKVVSALLWYIYKHFEPNSIKNEDGLIEQRRDLFATIKNESIFNEAQRTFGKCGIIDIKKESATANDKRMKKERILVAVKINRSILIKQIESMAPHLIIIGSKAVRDGILNEKILDLKQGETSLEKQNLKKNIPFRKDNFYVVYTSHPTRLSNL